jgi:ABC-2 type transport system ATP-binding protein
MTAALKLDHLTKSYGGPAVVDDLSLSIAPGEIFGLLGPNGAGKSTTINMVAGVTRIDQGAIEVFGYDNRHDYRLTRRLIGVMHQEIVTDNFFTIDRALKIHSGYYGVPDDRRWRETLVDRLDLGPHLHKSMNKLSGGLKRRFMVAKALIHKPRLLILDEPTAGVDVELRRSLWDFVREINRAGTTVLLTTHYLEEAEQMCNRIAIMGQGRLITLETTSALLAQIASRQWRLRLTVPLTEQPKALDDLNAKLEEGGAVLRLTLTDEQRPTELLARLQQLGIGFTDLETRKAGLEEVFIELTRMHRRPEAAHATALR